MEDHQMAVELKDADQFADSLFAAISVWKG
jgi:hypothetical protein